MVEITQENLRDLLAARGALKPCPACGARNWMLVKEHGKAPSIPFVMDDGSTVIPQTHIPATAMICSNCGFIRLHAEKLLEKFLSEDQVPDGGDDG